MPSLKDYITSQMLTDSFGIAEAISSRRNSKYGIEPNEIKSGDKVRVKSREDIEKMCKKLSGALAYYFDIPGGGGMTYLWITDVMLGMCGKKYTVDGASADGITVILKGDKYHWSWHIDLLEKV